MNIIIQLLGTIGLSFLFVRAEPMILFKRLLGFKEEEYDNYKSYKQFIYRLITCAYCSSFWISLIFLQDIYLIGAVTLLTMLIDKL